jgi:monothiol glutaredoxin
MFQRCTFASASGVEETHDDFKPKYKEKPLTSDKAKDVIKADISTHPVFLYMKGVPDAPNCGFSNMACRVLDAYGKNRLCHTASLNRMNF